MRMQLTTHKQTTESLAYALKSGILVPFSLSGMLRLRVTPLPASSLRLGGWALIFLSAVRTRTDTVPFVLTGPSRFPFGSEHQGAVDGVLSRTCPQAWRVLKVVPGLLVHVAVEPHDLASGAMHRPKRLREEMVFWGMTFRVGWALGSSPPTSMGVVMSSGVRWALPLPTHFLWVGPRTRLIVHLITCSSRGKRKERWKRGKADLF